MESLSKEKNLILGLLLGMAIAIAIPYAQPSELRASEEVTTVTEDRFDDVIQRVLNCINGGSISLLSTGINVNGSFSTRCRR